MNAQAEVRTVAVIGSGSWGLALAQSLCVAGHPVTVFSIESLPELRERWIPHRLPGVRLSEDIRLTNDLDEALAGARLVLVAVPSGAVREVGHALDRASLGEAILVSCTKGLEPDTLLRMSQVLVATLPMDRVEAVVALSGPSFALEVAKGQPTTAVVAGDSAAVREVQSALMSDIFRVYTSDDLPGVELGGALKNVLAIAAGLSDGLGFGYNAKAALVTRGLAEMTRVGTKMGARPYTFSGLSGLGDLVVTCTGQISRNRSFGERLARGMTLQEALDDIGMTVEGVATARAVTRLSATYEVEMPIASQVAQVLFEGKSPAEAVRDLMLREPKPELEREVYHAGA